MEHKKSTSDIKKDFPRQDSITQLKPMSTTNTGGIFKSSEINPFNHTTIGGRFKYHLRAQSFLNKNKDAIITS